MVLGVEEVEWLQQDDELTDVEGEGHNGGISCERLEGLGRTKE